MDQEATDLLTDVNQKLTYLEGSEFQRWKAEHLDSRSESYLAKAITAARKMTPESCFEAAHWLLLHDAVVQMGDGAILKLRGDKYDLENSTEETSAYRVQG